MPSRKSKKVGPKRSNKARKKASSVPKRSMKRSKHKVVDMTVFSPYESYKGYSFKNSKSSEISSLQSKVPILNRRNFKNRSSFKRSPKRSFRTSRSPRVKKGHLFSKEEEKHFNFRKKNRHKSIKRSRSRSRGSYKKSGIHNLINKMKNVRK